jgi:hypothetical protein
MISPEMFVDFCWQDILETCNYVDYSLYHLDGPDAVRHLPEILKLEKLNCVQWIQGAGQPYPSEWLDLLKQIQNAGKSVQLVYVPGHGDDADLTKEIDILCHELEPTKLFFWAIVNTVEKADALVKHAQQVCCEKRRTIR